MPQGSTSIDIKSTDFYWKGITLKNPINNLTTDWDEVSLKMNWENNGLDGLEGIYENANSDIVDTKYTLAIKLENGNYNLIYLGGNDNGTWEIGDIKAILSKTASSDLYKAKWYLADKNITDDLYVKFESGLMKIVWTNGKTTTPYIKLYPTSSLFIPAILTPDSGAS